MAERIRQFELKHGSGPHIERVDGERIVYEPGEVIHTTKNLMELFPHKFSEYGVSKKATIKKKSALHHDEGDEKEKKLLKAKQDEVKAEEEIDDENDPELKDDDSDDEDDGDETADAPVPSPKYGRDVTADFESAVKADLKVFKKKKGYTVVDADAPDKSLTKGKKLVTEKQVRKFISEYTSKE